MSKKQWGFTLIELMVVITLIAILAAFVLSVGSSMSEKARIANTRGTVLAILSACEQYKAVYYLYPHLDRAPDDTNRNVNNMTFTSPVTGGYTDNNCKEFNRRLRYMLEERSYIVDGRWNPATSETLREGVSQGPFLQQPLPKDVKDVGNLKDDTYVDAWGEELRVWWGRDHTDDIPVGPNYYSSVRNRFPPDIWSFGSNHEDNCNGNAAGTATDMDTTNSDVDDITSWHIKSN
jgi:prepilin-type N-terminal cleavage/methylation domain-containing protein